MTTTPDAELVITVVDTSDSSAVVIASNPTITHYGGVGIVAFCTGLDAGLRIAYDQYLIWEVRGAVPTMPLERSSDVLKPKRSSIALSDKAWESLSRHRDEHGYKGTAKNNGLFSFLGALIQHNPTPDMWTDTRHMHPEQLHAMDIERLHEGKLPLWSQAPDLIARIRKPRGILADSWYPLIPAYAALGRHYGISPYRGGSFENPSVVATATLEAIGLDYLTPDNWPNHPSPHPRVSKKGAATMRSREARKVYERFSF